MVCVEPRWGIGPAQPASPSRHRRRTPWRSRAHGKSSAGTSELHAHAGTLARGSAMAVPRTPRAAQHRPQRATRPRTANPYAAPPRSPQGGRTGRTTPTALALGRRRRANPWTSIQPCAIPATGQSASPRGPLAHRAPHRQPCRPPALAAVPGKSVGHRDRIPAIPFPWNGLDLYAVSRV